MRNKRLMGIFALASCVMLAGCGDEQKPHEHVFPDKWESNETQHWHQCECGEKKDLGNHIDLNKDNICDTCLRELPVPGPKIAILDLPESIMVGETIDLDDYVVTEGGISYDLNFDDDSFGRIELDDTKVTPISEGNINFTVSARGDEVDGSFFAMSETRAKYLELTEDVGCNYGLFSLEEDGSASLSTLHNDDFIYFDYMTEESGGGFAEIDGHVYQYLVDGQFTQAIAQPGYVSPMVFELYNLQIDLNDSYAYTKTVNFFGEPMEALEFGVFGDSDLTLTDVADIVGGIFGTVDSFVDSGVTYVASAIDFVFISEDENKEMCMCFPLYSPLTGDKLGSPYPHAGIYFLSVPDHPLFDEHELEVACIRTMIDEKQVPQPYDYTALKTALNNIIDGGNYSIVYDYGWFDDSGAELAPEDYPDMEGYIFEDCADSLVRGTDHVAVNAKAIANYTNADVGYAKSFGYMEVDGFVYNYALNAKNYDANKTSFTTIYHARLLDQRFGFLSSSSGDNELFPDDLVFAINESLNVYSLNAVAQNALFRKLLLSNATLAPMITKVMDPSLSRGNDIYSYFEGVATINPDSSVSFEWSIVWNNDQNFVISITVGGAGTTEIPADIISAVEAVVRSK